MTAKSTRISEHITDFIAVRISRSSTITLDAVPEETFPLFGPIREMEWAEGWTPQIIYGTSEAEEHMVFRTQSHHSDEEYLQWVITKLDRNNYIIEYIVSTKARIWFITVQCKAFNQQTLATITYEYTAFSSDAHERNKKAIEKMFSRNLTDWEEELNHYLRTGQKLVRNSK